MALNINRWIPDRKVLAGGVPAIAGFLVVTALVVFGGLEMDTETAVILAGLAGGIVTTAIAYLAPPSVQDRLKRINDDLLKRYGEAEPESLRRAAQGLGEGRPDA